MAKEILERSRMDPAYMWRLEDIYPSEAAFERDMEKAQGISENAAAWQGRVREDPMAAVRAYFEGSKVLSRLYSYAFMKADEDSADTVIGWFRENH